jgi:hypothetical protein
MSDHDFKPAYDQAAQPRLDVQPVAAAGDGFLLKLNRALERERIESAMDLARVLAVAGGVTLFTAGDGSLLVESAKFNLAVSVARSQGAI